MYCLREKIASKSNHQLWEDMVLNHEPLDIIDRSLEIFEIGRLLLSNTETASGKCP